MSQTDEANACQGCWARPWNVKFEWSYTGAEQYCAACLTQPIEQQPGKVLLDFMPDCQRITHRLTSPAGELVGRAVRYRSLAALYPVLTGRLP
jgi:hypothetical protein